MAADREVMWIRAITAASASSAHRIRVVPSALTRETYPAGKDPIQRLNPVNAGHGAQVTAWLTGNAVPQTRRRSVRVNRPACFGHGQDEGG
jgi:hypothetical protein